MRPGLAELDAWEAHRNRPAILLMSPIDDDTVPVLYQCLRALDPREQLDLVLATKGGAVSIARRIVLLLREFTSRLTVVVPHEARSAGTMICLGADELVMGPLAELSPIDPNLNSTWPPPPDGTGRLSSQDVRAFRSVAEDWFGVTSPEDRLQVLALVAQRIFPGTLAALYRFDRLCRNVAEELLGRQLPDADDDLRRRVVDQMVGGYDAHDHTITRADAVALGLNVSSSCAERDGVAWALLDAHRRQLLDRPGEPGREGITGFVASRWFCARRMQHWEANTVPLPPGLDEPGPQPPMTPVIRWATEPSDGDRAAVGSVGIEPVASEG